MFDRYAVYFTGPKGLAQLGAAWLGWDIGAGRVVPQPQGTGVDLPALTKGPRRYGFHATIKPPFALARGTCEQGLRLRLKDICAAQGQVEIPGLHVAVLGRFLALIPLAETPALGHLAAAVVVALDPFRAPMTEVEFERRAHSHLGPAQMQNLRNWGYPHVMEQFQFHMTLTGPLGKADRAPAKQAAARFFKSEMDAPLRVDRLALVGQDADGFFHEIEHYRLAADAD